MYCFLATQLGDWNLARVRNRLLKSCECLEEGWVLPLESGLQRRCRETLKTSKDTCSAVLCRSVRLQVSVTLDLKCSRKLKWKSHWKQGGNLCFSDTITRSLQMQQQQPRIDTWLPIFLEPMLLSNFYPFIHPVCTGNTWCIWALLQAPGVQFWTKQNLSSRS